MSGLRKQRKIVPLSSDDDEAFVFPDLAGRNISPLSKHFRGLTGQAGIEQRVIASVMNRVPAAAVNALSFHSLRHTFNSALANAGSRKKRAWR